MINTSLFIGDAIDEDEFRKCRHGWKFEFDLSRVLKFETSHLMNIQMKLVLCIAIDNRVNFWR